MDKYEITLVMLIISIFISNFIWLKMDTLPPSGNGLNDVMPGINFYSDIIHNRVIYEHAPYITKSPSSIKDFFSQIRSYISQNFFLYPPLAPLSYALFYLLFGPHTEMEFILHSIYLAIALYAIYGIGEKIFHKKAGLLSAFVFSSFPGIIIVTRCAFGEFFSMCLVALSLYLLLKTEYLQSRKYSVFLGISLGLTALAKWDFPPAIIGPFILVFCRAVNISKNTTTSSFSMTRAWKNFSLIVFIAILVSGWWYFSCYAFLAQRFIGKDARVDTADIASWMSPDKFLNTIQTLAYFLATIINVHLKLVFFILLCCLTIISIYRMMKNKIPFSLCDERSFYAYFLILWIFIPYISFTLTKLFQPSHMLLILPALAIVIGVGIFSFNHRIIKLLLISAIVLYGLYVHLHSFFYFNRKLDKFFEIQISLNPVCPDLGWAKRFLYRPDTRDWRIKDTLSVIRQDSYNLRRKPTVVIFQANIFLGYRDFQYYNLLQDYDMYIFPRGHDPSNYPAIISNFDYVIFTGRDDVINENFIKDRIVESGKSGDLIFSDWDKFIDFFEKGEYRLIKEFALPDYMKTKIYKLTENHMLKMGD